jgi:hypothetical protein
MANDLVPKVPINFVAKFVTIQRLDKVNTTDIPQLININD